MAENDEVRMLGTLLAGEVDGAVDDLARHILDSKWMLVHDERIRVEGRRAFASYLLSISESIKAAHEGYPVTFPEPTTHAAVRPEEMT